MCAALAIEEQPLPATTLYTVPHSPCNFATCTSVDALTKVVAMPKNYYTYCIYFWHRRTKYYLLLFSAHVSLLKEENFAIEHEVGEDAVSYLHMKVSNLALKGVTVTS